MATPSLDEFRRALVAATTQQTKTQQIGAAFAAVLDFVATFDDPKLSAASKELFNSAARAVMTHAALERIQTALRKVDEGATWYHQASTQSDVARNLSLLDAMGRSLEGACEMVKAVHPPSYPVRGAPLERQRAALGNLAMGRKCPFCELRPSDPELKGKSGRPPNSVEEMSVQLLAAAGVAFFFKHIKVTKTAVYVAVSQELHARKLVRVSKDTVRSWHKRFTSDPELAQTLRTRLANIEAHGTPLSLKEARVQFGHVCQWAIENVPNLPRGHRSH